MIGGGLRGLGLAGFCRALWFASSSSSAASATTTARTTTAAAAFSTSHFGGSRSNSHYSHSNTRRNNGGGLPAAHMASPYQPPSWTDGILTNPPQHGRLSLGNLPTPLYRLYPNNNPNKNNNIHAQQDALLTRAIPALSELDMTLYVKRDDSTGGVELGGNKIRKLEFLLAEALALDCDSVITIGGEQSNHCRATACAARMLGLEPHLILRTKKAAAANKDSPNDIGLVGNVLLDRMVGSHIYTCTPGEYGRLGSDEIVARLARHLQQQNKKPYSIPVGGSNGLGGWGYIEGVAELVQQWNGLVDQQTTSQWEDLMSTPTGDDSAKQQLQKVAADKDQTLDHVVFACGSGGTAAGIALGIHLAYRAQGFKDPTDFPVVHAIGVCDDPDYFYDFVAKIVKEMGLNEAPDVSGGKDKDIEAFVRRHMVVHQGKGLGYAVSTQKELDFVSQFARATGIVLDPVYSGKALYQFTQYVIQENNPESFRGTNVVFWHTGGALGLFDKVDGLLQSENGGGGGIADSSPCTRLDVYGKGIGLNLLGEFD